MKISIVTISFNQAQFLRDCMESVLGQDHQDIEYIVVDPGSTDDSRKIIKSYGDRVIQVFEKDAGASDGLNKGFLRATGDILCYLNSDDVFLPNAFSIVIKHFAEKKNADIVCGNAYIIDANSRRKRMVYSDKFDLTAAAYGAAIAIQPSTFFRKKAFEKCGGFNASNRSNWDGELLVDMVLHGAVIYRVDDILSCYRVHNSSITGTGKFASAHVQHSQNMFEKIMKRPYRDSDRFWSKYYRFRKHILNPRATLERLIHGPVFGSEK